MGDIALGFGAAHSPILFVSPEKWLARVHQGAPNSNEPDSFKLTPDNVAMAKKQVKRCLAAYSSLRSLLREVRPDCLLIIGDDQGENFTRHLMPPFAIYVGDRAAGSFSLGARIPEDEQEDVRKFTVPCDRQLAAGILQKCLDSGIEMAFSEELPGQDGLGHAHSWPLRYLTPDLDLPIVPLFVNAYFPPSATPARCYALGQAIKEAISESERRVAVFASGGLSHFPRHLSRWGIPAYPVEKRWEIDEQFDQRLLGDMIGRKGRKLAELTSDDLHAAGNVEARNWIVLAGLLGDRQGRLLAYESVRTVAIGMGFAVWT